MVTGIETAGLVLAVLPLVVQALGEYQVGVRKLSRSVKYDNELKKLIRSAKMQRIFFTDNLQKLLNAATPESGEIRNLSDDYSLELWSGPTGKQVQKYLGKEKCELFQEIVDDFESCLRDLVRELDHVRRSPKRKPTMVPLTLPDLRALITAHSQQANFFTKRFQYLIREDDVIRLTKDLNELNLGMDRLLANSNTLHQHLVESKLISNSGNASTLAALLQKVRDRADRLFQAFCEAWSLGCHSSHEVMLFLDTPVSSNGKLDSLNSNISAFKFRLVLRGKTTDVTGEALWHETSVTVLEEEEDEHVLKLAIRQTAVAWQTNPPKLPTISISPAQSGPQGSAQTRVNNLCKDIDRARDAQKRLELHLGKDLTCEDLDTCPLCTTTSSWDTINLEQLVSQKRRLLPGQKVSMALKLAASLLQLKTSQWLTVWTNQAIHFVRTSSQVQVEQPLIPQIFSHFNSHGWDKQLGKRPRPMFRELGILLLEISNEQTFADWANERHKIENIAEDQRAELAELWYEETYATMTLKYGKVVRTCLSFAFEYDQALPSWDDRDLRISVCAKIIEPLREECSIFPSLR